MSYLLPVTVLVLMVSIGMSLEPRRLVGHWRNLTPSLWARLTVATFLVPPVIALGLAHLLRLDPGATAGLFLVAVVPGAPLMTRNAAQKGFDLQLAASYQVWGAVLTPVLVPLLVAGGGMLYGRHIWVPPTTLLAVIARQQFLPFLAGMGLVWLAPAFSHHIQRALTFVGNALFVVVLAVVLYKMGPALAAASPWLALAAPLLAIGSLMAVRVLVRGPSPAIATLAICNTNRHVGLALLLAGHQLADTRPAPAIAAYAIAATLVMGLYAAYARRAGRGEE